jgi:hypothetical protein
MKTRKILDIHHRTRHIVCVFITDPKEPNPYRLYNLYFDGERNRRKQIAKYGDFHSILWMLELNYGWFGYD